MTAERMSDQSPLSLLHGQVFTCIKVLSDSSKICRSFLRATECIFLNQWVVKLSCYHEGRALGILKGAGCVPAESKKGLEGLGAGIKGKRGSENEGEPVSRLSFSYLIFFF